MFIVTTYLEEDPQIVSLLPELQQRHRPPIRCGKILHAIGTICQKKQHTQINISNPKLVSIVSIHLLHPAAPVSSCTRRTSRHARRRRRRRRTPRGGPLGPSLKRGLRAAGLRDGDLADAEKVVFLCAGDDVQHWQVPVIRVLTRFRARMCEMA